MIKVYLKGEQTNWDKNLGCLAGTYRATANESTGLTPNLIMLGREVRLPADSTLGPNKRDQNSAQNCGEYVENLREKFHKPIR